MAANLIGKRIKDNSRRKFSGGGPRPDRAEARRAAAVERNSDWAKLSAREQLRELDRRLGAGVGARKQRARIARGVPATY